MSDLQLLLRSRNTTSLERLWYALVAFFCVVSCCQWGSYLHSKFARRAHRQSDAEAATSPVYKFSLCRIPLALVNIYRVFAFRWTLQIGQSYTLNMAEIVVTMGYIALLLMCSYINTTSVEGQKLDIVYWSGRIGLLAASQFPIITALGTKNNIVTLVTCISYDRLNYIHRMMARTCFVLLCVHGAASAYSLPSFRLALDEVWLRMGITAMVAFSALIIVSLRPIRAQSYEVFLYTHLFAVLTFLLGGYCHTADYGSFWIWPSFVIWGADRAIRAIRLVVFNRSGSGTLNATTELISEDVVRLRLPRPAQFRWSPGQMAYLTMPSVSTLPFEAHPFTIASIDSNLLSLADKLTKENESNTLFWRELVFFINVHGGFTKKLKEVASMQGQVKVFVDGPYGPSHDLGSYDTSVLVAGGSGVSYTLPVFLSIIESARSGKFSCKRVVFIWSIRETTFIQGVEEVLVKAVQLAPPFLAVSIRIFVTGPSATQSGYALPSLTEKKSTHEHVLTRRASLLSLVPIRGLCTRIGRPNLDVLLKEEVCTATGRMSVNVCASRGIIRDVRRALCFPVSGPCSILHGGPSVTLHVESFG